MGMAQNLVFAAKTAEYEADRRKMLSDLSSEAKRSLSEPGSETGFSVSINADGTVNAIGAKGGRE